MFFPDRVQGFREARRVLPGGAIFSVWADLGANDFPEAITEVLETRLANPRASSCALLWPPLSSI
jgi:hypothetical protein